MSEPSISISLWINNEVNQSNPTFAIVPRSHVSTIRKDGNDRGLSKVMIGKVLNSCKAKFITGEPGASILFSVTEKNQESFF